MSEITPDQRAEVEAVARRLGAIWGKTFASAGIADALLEGTALQQAREADARHRRRIATLLPPRTP